MIKRAMCIAMLAAGCVPNIPETLGGQAKILLDSSDRVGHLDANLSMDSRDLTAHEIPALDSSGDERLKWAGMNDGEACFTVTTVQWTDAPDTTSVLSDWTSDAWVITTFDSREQAEATKDFPAEGGHLTGELTKLGLTKDNNYKVRIKLCGKPTNVKDTAKYLALIRLPPDKQHVGTLYLWAIDR
jgi:hypothetical protein